jgi:hypothetical protein
VTFQWAVTFELAEAAPETVRGEIVAEKPETAAFRAVKAAKTAKPNTRFRSLAVLIERLDMPARPSLHADPIPDATAIR